MSQSAEIAQVALAVLLACRWCGVNMGERCREWDKCVDHLHQDRLDDAASFMEYVSKGLVTDLASPPLQREGS